MQPEQASNDSTDSASPPDAGSQAARAYDTAHLSRVASALTSLQHPSSVGRYVDLELIAEGGMGSVYRAQQHAPIKRTVALKLIKLGMDTREVIARFESERQALAMMDHPHVAKVLDAGATDTGRPYFVMEYVAGKPITVFADEQKLSIHQRLELFIQACEAVQHAHQKAIIHRDLKPSNILVTQSDDGTPSAKVIDFGVAKALSHRLTERTLATETGQLVGTPEYMPPEQADGALHHDIDTRSDVYALGVVLYELLSGSLPFDAQTLRSGGYHEVQRIIREVAPPRPYFRLAKMPPGEAADVAHRRRTSVAALQRDLRSELEWIPLKAMRKARDDRYASAAEFAEDVRNYLSRRPLRAGPESRSYRFRKFLSRNRHSVAVAAVMGVLVIGGIVATTWQAIRATRAEHLATERLKEADSQRQKAESAAEDLRAVNQFLTEDLLQSAAPEVSRGREMTVREAVDRAAETVGQRFAGRPLTEAAIRSVVADTYEALGVRDRSLEQARQAMDLLVAQHGPDHRQSLAAREQYARALCYENRPAEAEPILRDVAGKLEQLLGPDDPAVLASLASLALSIRLQDRLAEAEPLYRRALEGQRRASPSDSEELASALNNLAVNLNMQERPDEAEPLFRESLEIKRRRFGGNHPSFLDSQLNFANVLVEQKKWDEAESIMRETLSIRRQILKDDHPSTMLTMNQLGFLLSLRKKYDEAESLYREAVDRRRRSLGDDHNDTVQSIQNLGALMRLRGRDAEAEPLLREAYERRRRILGEDHAYTVNSLSGWSATLERRGLFAEAEPLLVRLCDPQVLDRRTADERAAITVRYGVCLAAIGRPAEAERALLAGKGRLAEASPAVRAHLGRQALSALARIYDAAGRTDDAARTRAELAALPAEAPTPADAYRLPYPGATAPATRPAVPPSPRVPPTTSPTLREAVDRAAAAAADRFRGRPLVEAEVRRTLAETYEALGQLDAAMSHAIVVRDLTTSQLGPDSSEAIDATRRVARLLSINFKPVEAEKLLRDALARAERALSPIDKLTLSCAADLASSLRRQRRYEEAEPFYRRALEGAQRVYGPDSQEVGDLLNSLAVLADEKGDDVVALELFRQSLATRQQLGRDHPSVLSSLSNLGKALQTAGRLEEAEAHTREALAGRRRVLKDDNRLTLLTMNDLAWILAERKKFDEAILLVRESLERRKRTVGAEHPDTLQSMNSLGRILAAAGKTEEAILTLRQTMETRRTVLGELHPFTLGTTLALAGVFEEEDRFADAEPLLAYVCRSDRLAALPARQRPGLLVRYGEVLIGLGNHDAAEPVLIAAYESAAAGGDPVQSATVRRSALGLLVNVYEVAGREADARQRRAELAAIPAPATRPRR